MRTQQLKMYASVVGLLLQTATTDERPDNAGSVISQYPDALDDEKIRELAAAVVAYRKDPTDAKLRRVVSLAKGALR